MADRFPEETQTVELVESDMRYSSTSLLVVAELGYEVGDLHKPIGVEIDTNTNQIYVVEVYPPCVSIYSGSGEFLKVFKHKHLVCPWGISIHQDNIYITDTKKHWILLFKVGADIRLFGKTGGKGSGTGLFDMPRSLTVSTNGDVYVADFRNHRIQILDCDLKYPRYISHHEMTKPVDVKLTSKEIYVLSHTRSSSHCIYVFTNAGEILRSVITRGYNKQVLESYFFCLDPNENIIISDFDAHEIKIFSNEGRLLGTLGQQGGKVGTFYSPKGIALTKDLKLVVVSWNSYSLQVFS